jgi:hypothetical protein
MRTVLILAKWVARGAGGLLIVAIGLLVVAIVLGLGGVMLPFPDTDVTNQKPYIDFVGREYRVIADVEAHAWNDFPDKAKILSISLLPAPGVRNRFVSYVTPLPRGQRVRIVKALRQFAVLGFNRRYVVSVPGAGLSEDVPITIAVASDGVPDPLVYELVGR